MKKLIFYSVIMLLIVGCGSSKVFTAQENQAYQELQDLVASRSIEIVSNSASPMASAAFSRVANSNILGPGNNANYIDISSNANYFRIKGDTIQAFLPYFGEQTFGSSYGSNHSGIEFNDVPKSFDVIHNDKNHTVDLKLKIDDDYRSSDHYEITVTLFPNKRSIIRVQSTARSAIEYLGKVSAWEKDAGR